MLHGHEDTGFYPTWLGVSDGSIAPFVPSPMDVVGRMLDLAELKPGETFYDLGSGDGRVVIEAARRGARAFGVEMNMTLIDESRRHAIKHGLGDSAKFIEGNIFDVDLSEADVVTMYLLTLSNEKLRPKLERELKVGARVVTHDFPLAWKVEKRFDFEGESGKHVLYLYVRR